MRVLAGSAFGTTELTAALDELRPRVSRIYLHVDLDALDTSEGRANRFAAAGGLSTGQLEWAIEMVFDRFPVAAAALTAYDPSLDDDGRVARAAARVIATVARNARLQQVA
jgi:arginase